MTDCRIGRRNCAHGRPNVLPDRLNTGYVNNIIYTGAIVSIVE
jgi:hypothetical protein